MKFTSTGLPTENQTSAKRRQPSGADTPGLAPRRLALEILLRVEREHAFADVLLSRGLNRLPAIDRPLVNRLVLGTIAWQARLDYELSQYSVRRLSTLEPPVLAILRMGLFQSRMLTRIPPHAAVDSSVGLARTIGLERTAGFINAVLRSALRHPVKLPSRAADELEYLSIIYSHPRWLTELMLEWYGPETAATLMAADNQSAPNAIRLNLARAPAEDVIAVLRRDGIKLARGGRLPETAFLSGPVIQDGDAWRQGLFYPQGEASQLVSRLLAPEKGARVVDCAAAPGGKATHLAELVGPSGTVLALDLNRRGLENARALAHRLRLHNVMFVQADASALPLRPASAELVLLDAPCTGLGTLRQHPEIRWRLTRADIKRMAEVQRRMLAKAAGAVRPGGVLVYAVCSIAPEEGPEVIRTFVAENPGFEVDRNPPAIGELGGLLDREGFMRTRPDRDGLDGFFAARLKRRR